MCRRINISDRWWKAGPLCCWVEPKFCAILSLTTSLHLATRRRQQQQRRRRLLPASVYTYTHTALTLPRRLTVPTNQAAQPEFNTRCLTTLDDPDQHARLALAIRVSASASTKEETRPAWLHR